MSEQQKAEWLDVTPTDPTVIPHPYGMRFWRCSVCGNGVSFRTPPPWECVFTGTEHYAERDAVAEQAGG